MHFLKTAAFGAFALASLVVAQAPRLSFTSVPTEVTAGQPVTIQYTSQILTAPATIVLRKGDPSDLQDVTTLTSKSFSESLANASDYALQIAQGYQVNYSGQITLTGGNAAAVSSAKSASSSAKAAASSLTASAISSIESVIASYNSSLTNLTAIVSIQTSPPTPPANTTVVVVAPSVGTGSPIHRNTTIVSPTLTSSSGISSSSGSSRATSSSGTSTRGSSTSAAASASSTGAAATLAQASTPVLALFAVAAVFFFQ
ncbi:unnamed protein product [Aureobasidium pullulans]|nr:unnamed protein product [Aureobasidium pullulans]